MPIVWHENGLKSMQHRLAEHEAALIRAEAEIFRRKSMILKLEFQIAEAKRQGKDGFDESRFLQPRAKLSTDGQ